MDEPASGFLYEEHPDHPGWMRWGFRDTTRFNSFLGDVIVCVDGARARVRMMPGRQHSNLADRVHGGALLGFIDVALFAGARALDLIEPLPALTLDLNTHFVGAGRLGEPLEAQVECVRATGRLLFLRGLVVQGDEAVAEFSGTVRKPSRT